MKSKEALGDIRDYHNETVIDNYCTYTENMFEKELDIIEKDLEILEELDKHLKELQDNLYKITLDNPYYTIDTEAIDDKITDILENIKEELENE